MRAAMLLGDEMEREQLLSDSLADNPGDMSFERRIILQRDLNNILRSNYIERRREFTDTLDRWLLERLKANLTS